MPKRRKADHAKNLMRLISLGSILLLTGCSTALYQANNQMDRSHYEEAIPLLLEYLDSRPDAAAPRNLLGIAYLKSDRPDAAVTEFRRVLETEPKNPQANLYLGLIHLQRGEVEEAIAAWQNYRDLSRPLIDKEVKRQIAILQNVIQERRPGRPDAPSQERIDAPLLLQVEASIGRAIVREKNKRAEIERRLGDCG